MEEAESFQQGWQRNVAAVGWANWERQQGPSTLSGNIQPQNLKHKVINLKMPTGRAALGIGTHGGKQGKIMAVAVFCILAGATLVFGSSHEPTNYRSCSLGKGKPKLYNCNDKYDSQGTGSVRISDINSPARYLIKLRSNATARTVNEICDQAEAYRYRTYAGHCLHKYKRLWIGMLMMIDGGNLSRMLTQEAGSIDHVEVDGTMRVCSGVVQGNPPSWGIDRIDHLPGQRLLNSLYATAATGSGVHVYILDTGIRCSHNEFHFRDGRLNKTNGRPLTRCLSGFDAVKDGFGTNDCNGHGTHCAGIVGGLTTGVAKDVFLHPIRVMQCDGTGTYGAILAGLDWISHNVVYPAVVSMSIATQASISIDQAVNNLVENTGVIAVAAAGNFLQSTCEYSPARLPTVIAVGASNSANDMSWFSNYGTCTTLFAPGELVYSTYHLTDSSYAVLSGTSMACPHVAGTAALYLSESGDARPNDVHRAILDASEPYGVANLKPQTTTKLLNTNYRQPFYSIHPRSFYDVLESSTQGIVVSLLFKPSKPVTLRPWVDSSVGYFVPEQLVFGTNATWSRPQNISLVLLHNPDFLDHSSAISWIFTSQDAQHVTSPEGLVIAHDTDVCRKCGQTADNPKIIPSLPFYYLEDTSNYKNFFNESSNSSCHGSGPDVVFQYTATADMVINISLCGATTQFDTILTVYEKTSNSNNKSYRLTFMDCNDDFCGLQSFLMNVQLRKSHTYVIVVDGYMGSHGPFDFYMYSSGASLNPIQRKLPTSIAVITSITSNSLDQIGSTICTRWSGASCDPPPASLPIQAGFFWSPVGWKLCDRKCGGGSQQAVMQCFMGNYTEVDNSNCEAVPVPLQTQICNLVPCKTYSFVEGPWGECDQNCGSGTRKRQVICMDSLGNTADPTKCGDVPDSLTEQICNTEPCNDTRWEPGPWNFCNLPCGRGQKVRDLRCWSNGTVVGDNECKDLDPAVTKMDCNTHPCQTYAWLVGRWGECPAICNAKKSRVVKCVNGSGQNVGDAFCDAAKRPAVTTSCQRAGVSCNNCQQHNCSNHGSCLKFPNGRSQHTGEKAITFQAGRQSAGSECDCFKGWEGHYCERPKVCNGQPAGYITNSTVGCCSFSKVDNHQRCCGTRGAVIDINGACCDGVLDACGICNGPHKSIDSQNQCCTTVRDEKGICCASGVLDECHICDGDGTTCATNITIVALLNNSVETARNSSENWKHFMIQFMDGIATRLQVTAEALLLTGVETLRSETGSCHELSDVQQGCLTPVTKQFLGVFSFTVLPIPMNELGAMKIEKADITFRLSSPNDPNVEFIPGVKLQSVSNVQRVGICGNGMCERGERCDQFGNSESSSGPCCLEDCPYVARSCPIPIDGPKAGQPCSKNGLCLDASGQCDCFPGYQGENCGQCQSGWLGMKDGTCMKMVDLVRTQGGVNFSNINVTLPPGPWNDNITVTKGTAAASILGTIIGMSTVFGIICCVKYCCCSRTKGPHPPPNLAQMSLDAQREEEIKNANEARRKSLEAERHEAVQDRRKSRMYEGGADRRSLLMEPVIKPTQPESLTPAPMQAVPGHNLAKLRRSIVGDSALVIGGWRKPLNGDQDYAKLGPPDPNVERPYPSTRAAPSRQNDESQKNAALSPNKDDGQQYQSGTQTSKTPGIEGPMYQRTAQAGQGAQSYDPARLEGQYYQQNAHLGPDSSIYGAPPRYEALQYQMPPQFNPSSQPYPHQYDGYPYQNAPYPASQYHTGLTPQQRYESQQQLQNAQPYMYHQMFQPTQHFKIIRIPLSSAEQEAGAAVGSQGPAYDSITSQPPANQGFIGPGQSAYTNLASSQTRPNLNASGGGANSPALVVGSSLPSEAISSTKAPATVGPSGYTRASPSGTNSASLGSGSRPSPVPNPSNPSPAREATPSNSRSPSATTVKDPPLTDESLI